MKKRAVLGLRFLSLSLAVSIVAGMFVSSFGIGIRSSREQILPGVYDGAMIPISESGRLASTVVYKLPDHTRTDYNDETNKYEEVTVPGDSVVVPITRSTEMPDSVYEDAKTQVFSDVKPGDWYYETVNILASNGIIEGYPDGTFRPNAKITEGEFAMMLCRALKNFDENKQLTYPAEEFRRGEPNVVHDSQVTWADGVIDELSYGDKYFVDFDHANDECLRGTVASTLYRFLDQDAMTVQTYEYLAESGNIDYLLEPDPRNEWIENKKTEISDMDMISKLTEPGIGTDMAHFRWDHNLLDSEGSFMMAVMYGVLQGDETGALHLEEGITRAEVCQMFLNIGFWRANCFYALRDAAYRNARIG